jgi:hypothetical protein
MRRIAAVSLIASLHAFACGQQNDASQADGKADETKTPPEAGIVLEPPPPGQAPVGGVEGAPTPTPLPVPVPPPAKEEYGGEFCDTIIPCYQKLEFAGNFMADVSVDIEPDGSVSAVSFTGEAPKPVQTCITDAIKNTKLATYNGKPGRTRCTKSGQLMAGTQMIMSDRTYEERDPTIKAKANAEGKSEGKGEGKAKDKAG